MKTTITLTAEEIIDLILEKKIHRENVCISPNSSFLSVLALLDGELAIRMPHVRMP